MNKRIMIEYIKQTYGSDYEIIREHLGKSGAGGRHDDILTISQHGITYRVSAYEGKIVGDTYNNRMAGKILVEHLLSVVGEPKYDFSFDCTVGGVDELPSSVDDISKNRPNIRFDLFDVPQEKGKKWNGYMNFIKPLLSLIFMIYH
jgi:hypothetical protein